MAFAGNAKCYREGTNLVLLEPDVLEAFPTDKAVNQALRDLLNTARTSKVANKSVRPAQRRSRSKRS